MDNQRLKQAVAAVKRTRRKFNRLAERAESIDGRLAALPEPPPLDRPLRLLLLLSVLLFAGLIGLLAWLG